MHEELNYVIIIILPSFPSRVLNSYVHIFIPILSLRCSVYTSFSKEIAIQKQRNNIAMFAMLSCIYLVPDLLCSP